MLWLSIDAGLLFMLLYAVTGEIEQLGMLVLLTIGIGIVGIIVYLPLGGWVGQLAGMVVQSGLLVFALMWFYGLALQQAALIMGLFFGIKLAIAIVLGLLLASAEPEAFRPVDVPPGTVVFRSTTRTMIPAAAKLRESLVIR